MNVHSLIKTLFYRAGYSIKKLQPASPRGEEGNESSGLALDLAALLHEHSPYEGFDYERYANDPSGWGSDSPMFRKLIEEVRPDLIIEVGTWKGGSAIHMADLLRELKLESSILCIDTWLGALEFWDRLKFPERYGGLKLVNGYPSVYYEFLANVCYAGHQKRIIPFPQTSATAAIWLRRYGIVADLIYIDASHEEEAVYADLCDYWEVLRPGGVLLGDDWAWDGVRLAAERFSRENRLPITHGNGKWYLVKEGI